LSGETIRWRSSRPSRPSIRRSVWARIRREAEESVRREPELATFIYSTILHHDTLEAAIVYRLAERLDHPAVSGELIRQAMARRSRTFRCSARRSAPISWRPSTAIQRPTG